MTRRKVLLTKAALHDLEELADYLYRHAPQGRAAKLLAELEGLAASLAEQPERGAPVRELLKLGMREHREILTGPYRLIYRVGGEVVHIMVVADGRRDFGRLLQRRMLVDEEA